MFIDEAKITVLSGKGGDGIVHFRREKYVPRGGPDGGDGGKGSDVVLVVSPHLNTLYAFQHKKIFRAPNGSKGGGGWQFIRRGPAVGSLSGGAGWARECPFRHLTQ
jgi:GTP-binding protein